MKAQPRSDSHLLSFLCGLRVSLPPESSRDCGNSLSRGSLRYGLEALYSIAADVVMLSHLGYVTFVVLGFLLILIGIARGWTWVRNPWFRYAHLFAILIVVAEAWAGMTCPLTDWEKGLRQLAGEGTYEGGLHHESRPQRPLPLLASMGLHAPLLALRHRRNADVHVNPAATTVARDD